MCCWSVDSPLYICLQLLFRGKVTRNEKSSKFFFDRIEGLRNSRTLAKFDENHRKRKSDQNNVVYLQEVMLSKILHAHVPNPQPSADFIHTDPVPEKICVKMSSLEDCHDESYVENVEKLI